MQLGPLAASSFGVVTEGFSWDAQWVPRIRFDFDMDATRTTAFDLDFGEDGTNLGLLVGPDIAANLGATNLVDLLSTIDADGLALAVDVVEQGVDETGYADVDQLNLSADVNEANLTFDIAFGFLGAEVSTGMIDLQAGADATFTETTADDVLTGSELDTANVSVSTGTGANNGTTFTSDFPVTVKPGILPDPATPLGPFDGLSFSVDTVANSPFDPLPMVNFNGNQTLQDFTSVLAGDVLPMFGQLRDWLNELSRSDQLAIDLPLMDAQAQIDTLGELYDLGGAFEVDILDELSAQPSPEIDTQVAKFKTAQELGTLLTNLLTLLAGGTPVSATPTYDPALENAGVRY